MRRRRRYVMLPCMRNLLTVMALVIISARARIGAQADSTHAVTLRLAVDDSATNAPISGAIIELVGKAASARTDDGGRARFDGVALGQQHVRVRAIGYRPYNALVNVIRRAPDDDSETLIDLAPLPPELKAVKVRATRVQGDPDGFEARWRAGFGHFVLDTTFEQENTTPPADVIAEHVPGIVSTTLADGHHIIVSAAGKFILHPPSIARCPLDVFVDGVHQGGDFDIDAIPTMVFAAAEVYSTGAIPAQFRRLRSSDSSGSPECGVLVLWTKR